MNKLRNYMLAAAGFAMLVGSLALTGPYASHAQGQGQSVKPQAKAPDNVLVVNTTSQPVPTAAQGTTTIAGAVQAQQNGAWNVGITGTPSVNVANSPNVTVGNTAAAPVLVRDVDNPARQPFRFGTTLIIDSGFSVRDTSFTVPANKVLVVEYVSILGDMPTGQKLFAVLRTGGGDMLLDTHIVFTFQGNLNNRGNNRDRYVASQPVRVYADPNNPVIFRFERDSTIDVAEALVSLSGYLVDVGP